MRNVCLFLKCKNLCFGIQWTLGKHFFPPADCGSIFPAKSCQDVWRSGSLLARAWVNMADEAKLCSPILLYNVPDCTSHNYFKSWTNWATKFCLICHIHLTSHQPTTTFSSISTTFCRENASITSRRQKMLSWEFVESQRTDFYVTGINKLVSHWQKCDCNASYFD